MGELRLEDLSTPEIVFQIGVAPNRIDVLTSVDALEFDAAWGRRIQVEIDGESVPVLGREDPIRNKRATGRPQDLADVAWREANG